MGSAKSAQDGMMDGAPCHLECIPCSDKDTLWEFRGGVGAPLVDTEWIDPSRWEQVTPQVQQSSPIEKLQCSIVPGGHSEWSEHHLVGHFEDPLT